MPEDKYEFTFRLTDVELTDEQRDSVARAVTLAGVEAVGDALPPDFSTRLVATDDPRLAIHICGRPVVRDRDER
jgi:hypothetical protein